MHRRCCSFGTWVPGAPFTLSLDDRVVRHPDQKEPPAVTPAQTLRVHPSCIATAYVPV